MVTKRGLAIFFNIFQNIQVSFDKFGRIAYMSYKVFRELNGIFANKSLKLCISFHISHPVLLTKRLPYAPYLCKPILLSAICSAI